MTPIAHMKNKKILESRGFELQISGHESKTLPLDYCALGYRIALKYLTSQSISPTALLVFLSFFVPNHSLLANFSQFPPISANFRLYSSKLHIFWQLLSLININSVFIQSNTVFRQLRLISDCLNDKSYKLISTLCVSVHTTNMTKKISWVGPLALM